MHSGHLSGINSPTEKRGSLNRWFPTWGSGSQKSFNMLNYVIKSVVFQYESRIYWFHAQIFKCSHSNTPCMCLDFLLSSFSAGRHAHAASVCMTKVGSGIPFIITTPSILLVGELGQILRSRYVRWSPRFWIIIGKNILEQTAQWLRR